MSNFTAARHISGNFKIYENFVRHSYKLAHSYSRDKTNRRHVKEEKRGKRQTRNYPEPRGVGRRWDAKVASFTEGKSHGLTLGVYETSCEMSQAETRQKPKKIVVNLKQSVSTRVVLAGNRKQFNILLLYGHTIEKTFTRVWRYTFTCYF